MFSEEMIVLKLRNNLLSSFDNFSHIVLHEYTHTDCDGRLTKRKRRTILGLGEVSRAFTVRLLKGGCFT